MSYFFSARRKGNKNGRRKGKGLEVGKIGGEEKKGKQENEIKKNTDKISDLRLVKPFSLLQIKMK